MCSQLYQSSKILRISKKTDRLYDYPYPIFGITGGIATGKSTVLRLLSEHCAVISADSLVKRIYKWPETIAYVEQVYPGCVYMGNINFKLLRERFFNDWMVKKKIEKFILLRMSLAFYMEVIEKNFLACDIFYEIPLLFELELERKLDTTICVYLPRDIQIERLMKRDNISEELALKMLNSQMNIEDKRYLAHIQFNNQGTEKELEDQVSKFILNFAETPLF